MKQPVTNLPSGDRGGAPVGNNPTATGTLPLTGESTSTTMHPTKLAKLLKVALPLVQGGLAGGFGGNWRQPGSGFQAAQGFFNNQTQLALEKKQMANQQANQQSEMNLRLQEGQRQAALAQGAGRIYDAAGPDDEEHEFRIRPDGSSEDLGKKILPDQFQSINSGGNLMVLDKRHGTVEQPEDMNPEEHGALPLPGEDETRTLPFGSPQKEERPIVLDEGSEAVDPKSGKVIAKGQPKQFAPKTPKNAKPDTGRIETAASALLQRFGGDPQKALDAVDGLNSATGDEKVALRQRIREMKRPAPSGKRKFEFSPGNATQTQQQLQTQGQ